MEEQAEILDLGDSYPEQILRSTLQGYEDAFNKHSTVLQIHYQLTISVHKIATAEGNKDAAYLRIDRLSRDKTKEGDMIPSLVHQEIYFFRNLQERLNKDAPWKEQLYVNAVGKLVAGGLEYAEFLRKAKSIQDNQAKLDKTEEERLKDIGMEPAKDMPAPVDENYIKWLKDERAKEGL